MEDINDPILNDFYIYFEKEYILNYDVDNWNYYLQKNILLISFEKDIIPNY